MQTQTDVVATVFLGLRVARFNHLLTADRTSSNSESLDCRFSLFAGQRVCSCCSADSSAFSSEVIGSHVFASLMRMVGFKSRQTTQSHCRAKCFQFYLAFIIFALEFLAFQAIDRALLILSSYFIPLYNVVIFPRLPTDHLCHQLMRMHLAFLLNSRSGFIASQTEKTI